MVRKVKEKKVNREKGAIVVDATISLTAFVFAIFAILSIVDIAFVQAKMGVALNTAAKEVSQYSYLYYKFNLNTYRSELSKSAEESRELINRTIDGIGEVSNVLSDVSDTVGEVKQGVNQASQAINQSQNVSQSIDALKQAGNTIDSIDFDGLATEVEQAGKTVDSLVTEYADAICNDPKQFVLGMGKFALSSATEGGVSLLGKVMGKAFMKKNLKAFSDDDPDAFLKRHRVVNGIDGLKFDYTTLMAYGNTDDVILVVTYEVQVVRVFNIDFKFKFRQCAKTKAWGNGISLIPKPTSAAEDAKEEETKESVWDMPAMKRGNTIIAEEKKKYTYTSSGKGFDAYDNSNEKNEFISIVTMDTNAASNRTASDIAKKLKRDDVSSLLNSVSKLKEEINVTKSDGNKTAITSKVDTRTYKLILVVPDSTNMSIVNQAIKEINKEYSNVKIEVKTGYGDPTPESEKKIQETKKEDTQVSKEIDGGQ